VSEKKNCNHAVIILIAIGVVMTLIGAIGLVAVAFRFMIME
jgi:hypothetical protein